MHYLYRSAYAVITVNFLAKLIRMILCGLGRPVYCIWQKKTGAMHTTFLGYFTGERLDTDSLYATLQSIDPCVLRVSFEPMCKKKDIYEYDMPCAELDIVLKRYSITPYYKVKK